MCVFLGVQIASYLNLNLKKEVLKRFSNRLLLYFFFSVRFLLGFRIVANISVTRKK